MIVAQPETLQHIIARCFYDRLIPVSILVLSPHCYLGFRGLPERRRDVVQVGKEEGRDPMPVNWYQVRSSRPKGRKRQTCENLI